MKVTIETLITESGLWEGARRETHQFLLTPELFPLNPNQVAWLRNLGQALHQCLSGLGRIATTAADQLLTKNKTWHMIRRLVRIEVPPLFRALQLARPSTPPTVFRIDVVEDTAGNFFVVEIEATKSHGLGYATLFAQVAKHLGAGRTLPGVAKLLSAEVRRRHPAGAPLVLLYAANERFYLPEFEVLRRALAQEDTLLIIASEHEVSVANDSLFIRGIAVDCPVLLGLPIFFGSRDRAPNKMAELALTDLYRRGVIDCLIPPKPFLGSKGMMALIRNDTMNPEVEAILHSHVGREPLRMVRAALPETALVEPGFALPEISPDKRYVLKKLVSSGAHGIMFSDDPRFETAFQAARQTRGRCILQRVIETRQRALHYYPRGLEVEATELWHTRIGVFYIARELAEVCVTGCREPPVHGGKDAIFMGSTLI